MAKATEKVVPKKIVATASATAKKTPLGKDIEKAMSEAVTKAYADGVTDPVKIKERMMEARKKVIADAQAAETKKKGVSE